MECQTVGKIILMAIQLIGYVYEVPSGAAYAKMTALQPMPSTELERLASLLHRLVKSCLTIPEPPGKWCIIHSQRADPGDNASVVVRIDQYLSDLAAFRDDSHLAAWQSHSIKGHIWEAFTYL